MSGTKGLLGDKPFVLTPPPAPRAFNGPVYDPALDFERLNGQIGRVARAMQDGQWRTLSEIAKITGDPPASISAQLRHLKKAKWGSHGLDKRARGDRGAGLFEYRLILRTTNQETAP